MQNETPAGARLLFVVDNDYGALGTMMYFLHGQALAARSRLLLPRRVHELHGPSLAVESRPYASLRDILQAADEVRPDLVLLASGYLFAPQGLLRVSGVQALVRGLAARGCRVATTDPYLGTFRSLPAAVARSGSAKGPVGRLAAFVRERRFERHVRRVAAALEGLPHFYPVPMPAEAGAPRRFSFFNPRYIRDLPGAAAATPRWLFVLAGFDLELQERRYGREGFAEIVAARLREAIGQGRDPTFIGPPDFVQALARRFEGDARVTLLAGCPWSEFERRLLEAEAAFYWQLFSTSSFLRLWNGLPVFFFDEGHNARLLPPMREAGLERYYMGVVPVHLDIELPLDAARLLERRGEFRDAARRALRGLAPLPDPPGMVEEILAAR